METKEKNVNSQRLQDSKSLISDLRKIIEQGRRAAYAAVNQSIVLTYWHIGERIVEEEQHGQQRASYGTNLIALLAEQLTNEFGKGFSYRSLNEYRRFYLNFKDLEIVHTRVHNLTWSHFRIIMREPTPEGRMWYVKEASEQMWSVRTLERNVTTQYYGRMLAAQRESLVLPDTQTEKADPLEYIKNPVVAEFMGFHRDTNFSENQLEQAMPTEEELRREIEQQKRFFLEQHSK